MEYTFKDLARSLSYEEALSLQRDVQKGAPMLREQLKMRIDEERRSHASSCAVCGVTLQPAHVSYTLLFGPPDFLKRASCCGMDCLEYFFGDLKDLRRAT